jgi:hypothetical protein
VRCPQCASDNPPEYRFCGMCGTPLGKRETPLREPVSVRHDTAAENLREPAPRTEPLRPERHPEPVSSLSGPSFLGLGGEPARGNGRSDSDISYLFDDEDVRPRRTYWRFMLLLLIVAVIGGLVYLQYAKEGKSWTAPWARQQPTTPVQASQTDQQNQAAQTGSPAAANQGPATPAAGTPPASTPNANAETPSETQSTPPASSSDKQSAASDNAATDGTAAEAGKTQPDKTETAKAETPSDENDTSSEEAPAPEPAKPVRAAKPKPARAAAPAVSPDDALITNAEKYLYGRGVPQNCDRALSGLRSAAQRDNTRARTLLGTMYATGHCVPKDLPNAYRWFAQASRTSPDNMWVQRNLEMIWREMTPQERQLATKSQ